jgi:hypothetical protein
MLDSRIFRQFESDSITYYQRGSHTIPLDESLLDMLDTIINPMEEPMFNPLTVGNKTFTVEVMKQDGTLGTLTGKLVAPNYDGTADDLLAYSAGLLEKDLTPIYTDKGWRSFYQSKVVSFTFGG